MAKENKKYRQTSAVFDERATEYDQWFDDSLLFRIELATLRDLQTPLSGPGVEIGVGPGRFARELGVTFGIDPALAPLYLAGKRGVKTAQATGEALPFRRHCLGAIFILFSLCFMTDPAAVLFECFRTLKEEGRLVLGIINGRSSWGRRLSAKKAENHPFYRYADFYDPDMAHELLYKTGFALVETRSSLIQPPEKLAEFEKSRSGLVQEAGFIVLAAKKVSS